MLSQIKAQVPQSLNGERFDVAAAALCQSLSRKKIKMIIDRGGAYLNKKRVLIAKRIVSAGDVIELFWDENRPLGSNDVKNLPVGIIGENEDFVVVNKPAGLPSQATLTSSEETVLHALSAQYPDRFTIGRLYLVHRLDKETSGIMLIAKNKTAQQDLEKLFAERKVRKVYHALTFGIPLKVEGRLDWPLRKDPSRPNTYFAVLNKRSGQSAQSSGKDIKSALTSYLVLKTFQGLGASYIECRPETGRTHQIRVHLQALGVPLLGDKTYSNNVIGHPCGQWAARHMLHAFSISWTDKDGRTFAFEAPLPDDFRVCLNRLAKEGSSHELQTD
ncbi:MAG: RluA family pseudouridine synthase [Proteobacteria bacterium]|nr:RluA family pseudouridine synthase [Pseudomonadota bacterium]